MQEEDVSPRFIISSDHSEGYLNKKSKDRGNPDKSFFRLLKERLNLAK